MPYILEDIISITKDSIETAIGEDVGGSSVKEFLTFFSNEEEALPATVEVKNKMCNKIYKCHIGIVAS